MDREAVEDLIGGRAAEKRAALDIGCGLVRAEPGAIGIDWSPESGAEVVWT